MQPLEAKTMRPVNAGALVSALRGAVCLRSSADRTDHRSRVNIRGGPSSARRGDVACLGFGASAGVCTGAKDGAYGAGSCSYQSRAAAAVE
jgi:hypothetical protein